MKKRIWAFAIPAVILLAVFLVPSLLTRQSSVMDKPSKEDVAHKMQSIQIPFVANNGQVDKQVRFYAKTFGGAVFVTQNGEIVYSLPGNGSESGVESLESDGRRQRSESNPKSAIQNLSSTSIGDLKSGVAIKETLVGGRVHEITGNEKAVTKVSYFKGNDPSQWESNISTYDVVSLGEVYDGIELKLKAYGNNVEKLFCVKSGANPEQIKISLSGIQPSGNPPPLSPSVRGTGGCPPLALAGGGLGARGLWVNEHGELVAETELGPVKFTKPIAYQEINGKRVDVECKYTIADCGMQNADCKTNLKSETQNLSSTEIRDLKSTIRNVDAEVSNPKSAIHNLKSEYGFTVASYDKTKDLIIDPLLASTFLGGSSGDGISSLTLDTSGNVYVTGNTNSTDFPTTSGAYDTSFNGSGEDVFVSKLNGGLTSLLASTYLGGSYIDDASSLALDTSGNVYVTGYTRSTDFPTTSGAYDTSHNGYNDVFVSKLNSGLTSLLASTYLGGSIDDTGYSLTLDTSGNVFVTGYTWSTDFPTTSGAYDTSYNGSGDAFVSKLDGGLASLLASTFLGGSGVDYANSLTLDTSGNVYVTGNTCSTDFPTTSGAYDTSHNGITSDNFGRDAFVSKLNGGLTSLLASTFLGGSGINAGSSLALDTSGNVYVTGYTWSTDFPTTSGAYDTSYNGITSDNFGRDAFVSKLDGGLASLLASTFLGGSGVDYANSLTLDTSGNVYVTGNTNSTDFPTMSGAYDTSYNGGESDAFVSKLDSGLTSLLASTYLGGSGQDWGNSLTLDTSGNVFVTGYTWSTDFPTTSGAYDTSFDGSFDDGFVSKLDGDLSLFSTPTPTPTPSTSPTPTGGNSIIFGFVHDEEDNVLRGVSVAIKGDTYSNRTENDADGYYEFRNLSAGDYALTYEKDGYQTYTKSISLGDGEIQDLGTITLETVVPTPTPSPTPLSSNIFGFVYDSEEEPIQDVTVTIEGDNYSGSTSTDEYGYYELKNLSRGNYTLTYSKEGYQTQTQDANLGENENQDRGILTLESVEKGSIFGYVVDFRGYEIGSATIRMKGLNTGYSKTISSDIDGYFEFTDLDADTYILTVKKSGYRQGKRIVKLRGGEVREVKLKMKRKRTTSVQSQF